MMGLGMWVWARDRGRGAAGGVRGSSVSTLSRGGGVGWDDRDLVFFEREKVLLKRIRRRNHVPAEIVGMREAKRCC